MITRDEAYKTLQKNKSLIWLLTNVFNDFNSNIPSTIKPGTGELLDNLYDDLEKLEEYFSEEKVGG